MKQRDMLGILCRLLSFSALFVLALVSLAAARVWEVDFRQDEFAIAYLKPAPSVGAEHACENGFEPVQLDVQIDANKIGRLSVETHSPENYQSTAVDAARIKQHLNLSIDITVQGCAFRSHLVPYAAFAKLNGVLGPISIKPSQFSFADDQDENTLGVSYVAQLAGTVGRRISI
ncbi:MAG: hypothetical protein AAFX90_07145 [Pseudomonadota bacterium]